LSKAVKTPNCKAVGDMTASARAGGEGKSEKAAWGWGGDGGGPLGGGWEKWVLNVEKKICTGWTKGETVMYNKVSKKVTIACDKIGGEAQKDDTRSEQKN